MKKVIIVFGIWGIGKSYYCTNFVKEHPEYIIAGAETSIDELLKNKYVIMDYYFYNDYNANKLRESLNCPVEIRVLYDDPEIITKRQIYYKTNEQNVSCYASINLYSKDYKELIDLSTCKIFYKEKEITIEEFKNKIVENNKPYTQEKIIEHMDWMRKNEGDPDYQDMDFSYGIKLGKEGYSRNKQEWNILKDLIDWKNKKVLELGGYHGYFSQEIWNIGGIPTLIDIEPSVLYTASIFARIKEMNFAIIKKDLNIGFPDGQYDIALCMNILHHIKNQNLLFDYLKNLPLILFAINKGDVNKIDKYFDSIRVLNSPKDNRIFCLVKPK